MSAPDPLDDFLEQTKRLMEILRKAEKEALEAKLDPEIEGKVQSLESKVNIFNKVHQNILYAIGEQKQKIEQAIEKPDILSGRDRSRMLLLNRLKKEAEAAQKQLKEAMTKLKKEKPKSVIERKKRFDKMGGGHKDWKAI